MEKDNLPSKDTSRQQTLPNSQGALVLGIISIVTFCCCYGIIGLICGIIAIVLANKAMTLYDSSPENYTEKSLGNAKAGKTCGLIGIILSAVILVVIIVMFSSGIYQEMLKELIEQLQDKGFDF